MSAHASELGLLLLNVLKNAQSRRNYTSYKIPGKSYKIPGKSVILQLYAKSGGFW
jgi:hypothetical protein